MRDEDARKANNFTHFLCYTARSFSQSPRMYINNGQEKHGERTRGPSFHKRMSCIQTPVSHPFPFRHLRHLGGPGRSLPGVRPAQPSPAPAHAHLGQCHFPPPLRAPCPAPAFCKEQEKAARAAALALDTGSSPWAPRRPPRGLSHAFESHPLMQKALMKSRMLGSREPPQDTPIACLML